MIIAKLGTLGKYKVHGTNINGRSFQSIWSSTKMIKGSTGSIVVFSSILFKHQYLHSLLH